MNAKQNMKSGSTLEQEIHSINMPEYQREQVLHQARVAEAFVNAIVWVCGKFERPGASVFAKPSPKY